MIQSTLEMLICAIFFCSEINLTTTEWVSLLIPKSRHAFTILAGPTLLRLDSCHVLQQCASWQFNSKVAALWVNDGLFSGMADLLVSH